MELPSHVPCAAPSSPEEATKVMCLSVAFTNSLCCAARRFESTQLSFSPKLCEMMSPRLWSTAYCVALKMSASSLVLASTRVMFAPGAMAWAHSTSNEISAAHPVMLLSPGTNGVSPSGAIWVNLPRLGSFGRPSPFRPGSRKSYQARSAAP